METRNLKLAYLEAMPTLHEGQYDDLKLENENTRVWLSRLTVEDGMPYDNQVTVEKLKEAEESKQKRKPKRSSTLILGRAWITVYTYQAK